MTERRGHGEWHRHTRYIEYCSGCGTSSAFELIEENGDKILICCGDQRAGRKSCGNRVPFNPQRLYGDCTTCRQVRRSFKAPDGKFYCCYCTQPAENVASFGENRPS